MGQLFASGGQSIRASASASVLPMNIQDWFPLGLTDLISFLAVQGTLKSLLQYHNSKASILWCSAFFMVQLSHQYLTTGETIALTIRTFVAKMMSLLFNILSRFVTDFLAKSVTALFSPRHTTWKVMEMNNGDSSTVLWVYLKLLKSNLKINKKVNTILCDLTTKNFIPIF